MKHACEAHMVACKGGMKADEAAETVGHAMKLAKMMSAHKGEDKKEEEPKAEDKKEGDDVAEAKFDAKGLDAKDEDKNEQPKATFGDKGLEEANLKLKGEVASLRESLKKVEVEKYVDTKLAATKLPRSHTKTIRESLATCRTEAEVDQKISLFLEGYKLGGEADGLDWIVSAEKTTGVESGVSFADCAN